MQSRVRTTITLPEGLLEEAKIYSVKKKTNLSNLIAQALAKEVRLPASKGQKLHMKLGKYSLGVKNHLRREDIYADYLKHKISS